MKHILFKIANLIVLLSIVPISVVVLALLAYIFFSSTGVWEKVFCIWGWVVIISMGISFIGLIMEGRK